MFLSAGLDFMSEEYPAHVFHPYIQLWLDVVNRVNLMPPNCLLTNGPRSDAQAAAAALNRVVNAIRCEAATAAFRTMVKKHRRAVTKNFVGCRRYVECLFHNSARLQVVRIDLEYLSHRALGKKTDSAKRVRDLEQVKADWVNMRAHLGKAYKSSLLGYICKLESALSTGHHFHLIVFLDGSKIRQDIVVGKALCHHWDHVIAPNRGRAYNCNANAGNYRFVGIGEVRHDDDERRATLVKAVEYICKPDFLLRFAPEGPRVRTLFRGVMPALSIETRGRKRRASVEFENAAECIVMTEVAV